jgi:hypothetical protein
MHNGADDEKDTMKMYEIHVSDWHASHALRREYTTVLHLHKLLSSIPLGPE